MSRKHAQRRQPGRPVVPRTSKPRPQGSFVRRRLVGSVPLHRLPAPARAFIEEAEAVDRTLLSRGWIFDDAALPGVLLWMWPASVIDDHDTSGYDYLYGHELNPDTSVGYFPDALEPTTLHLTRAGLCSYLGDEEFTAAEFTGRLDEIEAHRASPNMAHQCVMAGAAMEPPDNEADRRPDLLYNEPLRFPISEFEQRAADTAAAHGGNPVRLRRFLDALDIPIRDRNGDALILPLHEDQEALMRAVDRGLVSWDGSELTYVCTDRTTSWEELYSELADGTEPGSGPALLRRSSPTALP